MNTILPFICGEYVANELKLEREKRYMVGKKGNVILPFQEYPVTISCTSGTIVAYFSACNHEVSIGLFR